MGAEANTVASLLEKLKVDDPWVPPKPWESIPSEGGGSRRCSSNSRSSSGFYNVSNLSVSSLHYLFACVWCVFKLTITNVFLHFEIVLLVKSFCLWNVEFHLRLGYSILILYELFLLFFQFFILRWWMLYICIVLVLCLISW